MIERYKLKIVNNDGDQYIRCEPAPGGSWVMFEDVDAMQARIEAAAAELARLRAALATARLEGMEDAARWHEMLSVKLSAQAGLVRNFRQLLRQSDFHMESAAAIRAAAKEGKP